MNKQWKLVVKLSFVLFVCLFVALPIRGAAESYLNDSGQLEFKVDRIEKTDEEKRNPEQKETELDKRSIDLFSEETTSLMEDRKRQETQEKEELYSSLFLDEQIVNPLKSTLQTLFHSDYAVKLEGKEMNQGDKMNGESISNVVTGLLIAVIALICIGIYIILRKSWR